MNSIKFDEHGNPQPYEIIQLSYQNCKKIFVDDFSTSKTRNSNWANFLRFHTDIEKASTFSVKHWIDGSFVTKKIDPGDIDVVSFVNSQNFTNALLQFDMNLSDPVCFVKTLYNVDNYIVIDFEDTHPYYIKMQEQIKYWQEFFSSDRNDKPKAIIEVVS